VAVPLFSDFLEIFPIFFFFSRLNIDGFGENSSSVRLRVVAALHINENYYVGRGRPSPTKSRDLETSSRDLELFHREKKT
jgi:hypothetical protein